MRAMNKLKRYNIHLLSCNRTRPADFSLNQPLDLAVRTGKNKTHLMNQPAAGFDWRKQLMILSVMLMLAGMLFSRLVLSSALILFLLASILHREFISQLKEFFSSPVLWSMSLLFFIPLISGIWS